MTHVMKYAGDAFSKTGEGITSLNPTSGLWSELLLRQMGLSGRAAESDADGVGPNCCWVICNICCWVVC